MRTPAEIPQTDPGAACQAHRAEIDAAIARVLGSGRYVLAEEGAAFEAEFAAWLGARRAVGCASGTDALVLALRGLGVGPGASVVTVSHTAVATVAAIELAGAVPLLLDVEPDCYTMDPAELAAVLDRPPRGLPPIRAAIPVHLYGQAVDMDPILAACDRHGVAVIEDCSQAHGATLCGRRVGTLGVAAAFSFYPTKNLGALGDGGAVVTSDPALADRIAALRQYGWRGNRVSGEPGMNSRLDEVQAAVLRVGLRHLAARNARRAAVAAIYDDALAGSLLRSPPRRPGTGHVFHQYVVQLPDRDAARGRLRSQGIGTAVHYPLPVHRQPAYAGRVALGPSRCRITEALSAAILSLPMFPELTAAQVERVCLALWGVAGTLSVRER